MESGETSDGQAYAGHQQQHLNTWNGIGSPPVDVTPKSSDGQIPVYFNTTDNHMTNTPSPYPQPQKSPAIQQQNTMPNPAAQGYPDQYRYQHAPSPGPGRMNHRMPGQYPGAMSWPSNNNLATPQHPSYMSPDRGRYNPRPPYPGYEPGKPYPHTPQPGNPSRGPWLRATYMSPHPPYNDPARMSRYVQPDIAGPVIPAGLQALQSNNNNATLMQHQHTPMLVPNPHYNQSRAQQGPPLVVNNNKSEPPKPDQQTPQRTPTMAPTHDNNMYSPTSTNTPTPNYYSTQSPHPQQHPSVGPIHHQVGLNSPSVSPYPTNPATPGSAKSKARGNKCYQCPKCVKVFRRGDHLKRHLLSVHDHEHPYQCGECGKGFASVPTLLKHAKSLHVGALAKGLMCLRCQLTFGSFQEIETHASTLHIQEDEMYMQNINSSSKQHSCNACTKSFSSAANLKRHMQLLHRSKEDSKLFCRECGKSFNRVDGLRKHIDKVHSGNPNAMPPIDELDDMDTLSQAHSSESESRGPSADTDESSLSAPPSNTHWGGYPTPAPHLVDQRPGSHGPGQLLTAPPPLPAYQPQYQHQTNTAAQENIPTGNQPTTTLPSPLSTSIPPSIPKPAPPQNGKTDMQVTESQVKMVQVTNAGVATGLGTHAPLGAIVTQAGMGAVPMDPAPAEKIEPKSVSEALSMAMKALSDFDYENSGVEVYPFSNVPMIAPQPMQQHRNYMHQPQMFMPQLRNGLPTGGSPRLPGAGPLPTMPPYGGNSNHEYSRQGVNFLMTMPPPPGSMTTAHPRLQHVMSGVQEAPQLSQLLQEGGGGVNTPNVINDNNNNCNGVLALCADTPGKFRNGLKRRKKLDMDEDEGSLPEQDGMAEKVDLSCTICKIEYDTIDNLMGHIEGVHLKKNPHECCICRKHFAQAGNVKRHIRFVHLRERPFRCKDCSCTFDRLCYLQRHMRTHLQLSEENQEFNPLKPCSCPECGKRCLTAHHLRGHMQRKHFAKNKQNYAQFLAKYGHLEALGTGPGAIRNQQKGRKGRKKKRSEDDTHGEVMGFMQPELHNPGILHNSSTMPNSSSERNTLSTMPQYQFAPPQTIAPAMQFSTSMYTSASHQNFDYNPQMKVEMAYDAGAIRQVPTQVVSNPPQPPIVEHQQLFGNQQFGFNSVNGRDLSYNGAQVLSSVEYNAENIFAITQQGQVKFGKGAKRLTAWKQKKILPYKCVKCVFRSFASLAMLKSHLSVAHNAALRRHVCMRCGKSFMTRSELQSHTLEIHKKNYPRIKVNKTQPNALKTFTEMSSIPQMGNINQAHINPPQQVVPMGYPQNMAYCPPSQQQPYYGYDPNSPAMVPSPNLQTAYVPPSHQITAQMPFIQT